MRTLLESREETNMPHQTQLPHVSIDSSLEELKTRFRAMVNNYDQLNTAYVPIDNGSVKDYLGSRVKHFCSRFSFSNGLQFHGETGRKRATEIAAILNDPSHTTPAALKKALATYVHAHPGSSFMHEIFSTLLQTVYVEKKVMPQNTTRFGAGIPVMPQDHTWYERAYKALGVELPKPEPQLQIPRASML
jgi:hypothetical protein